MQHLRFAVVGLGGYGLTHIEAVRWLMQRGLGKLTAVVALEVDRMQRPDLVKSLLDEGVTLYDNLDQFMASGVPNADVLTVPIGINMHVPVSIAAMRAGLHVYCEKPAAATVQEVDRLTAVAKETGRIVAIGFQHIFSNSIQQLKERICDGRLGNVRFVALICGWPRSRQYYSRNEWTGRLRLGEDWILDSPANNAHAHYLMNVLYLASPARYSSATPETLRAELYRAYPIEGPDTVQLQFSTTTGAKGHVIFTHTNCRELPPFMRLDCEKGRVFWQNDNGRTYIRYFSGKTEEFDNLVHDKWRFGGFGNLVDAVRGGGLLLCTPEVARAQTVAVNAMHESCPGVVEVPAEFVTEVEDWEMHPPNTRGMFRRIRNLDEYIRVALDEGEFLSALGIPWATPQHSSTFAIGEYRHFPRSDTHTPALKALRTD